MTFRPSLIILAFAISAHGELATAQAGGGGSCDSAFTYTVTAQYLGGTTYEFSFVMDTTDYVPLSAEWNFGNSGTSLIGLGAVTHDFMVPGNYIACVSVQAEGPLDTCVVTKCIPLTISTYTTNSECLLAEVDFTATVTNGVFTFDLVTPLMSPVLSAQWSFGDGIYASGTPIAYEFLGPGPFQVCLTALLFDQGLQDSCSYTVCHWVYLGPDTLPCSAVLQPAFSFASYLGFVAFFDQSNSTGSPRLLSWDLGDGTFSAASSFIHEYDVPDPTYTVCLTVSTWGPLAPDTCIATVCEYVGSPLAGVEDHHSDAAIRLWPNPTTGILNLAWPDAGGSSSVTILDAGGRALVHERGGATGVAIDVGHLAPGQYVVMLRSNAVVRQVRFVKIP